MKLVEFRTLLLGSIVSALVFGYEPKFDQGPTARVYSLIFQLECRTLEAYYGSGILKEVSPSEYIVVTNAHVLPRLRKNWKFVEARSSVTQHEKRPVKVLGVAPGYDIALLSIPRRAGDPSLEAVQVALQGAFESSTPLKGRWIGALLGVETYGGDGKPYLKGMEWAREKEWLDQGTVEPEALDWNPFVHPEKARSVITPRLTEECAPPFLKSCYHVSIRAAGYSGGALIVAPPKKFGPEWPKIAGMVSHFSPLTEVTLVIPWREVEKITNRLFVGYAERVNDTGKDIPYVDSLDETGTFQVEGGVLKVLAGPLKGRAFRSAVADPLETSLFGVAEAAGGESSGGGGESSGGGGESSGGGGESSGGGGGTSESVPDWYLMQDLMGNVTGLIDFDALASEIYRPELWETRESLIGALLKRTFYARGSDSVLRYRPGVAEWADNKPGRAFYLLGEKPLTNLQAFIRAYLQESDSPRELSDKYPKVIPPENVSLTKDGAYVALDYFRMKDWATISAQGPEYLRHAFPTYEEIAMLLLRAKRGAKLNGKKVDALTMRARVLWSGTFRRAALRSAGKKPVLEATMWGSGKIVITFKSAFEQTGPGTYRFVGPITYRRMGVQMPTENTAHCFASLQINPESGLSELRLIIGYEMPSEALRSMDPESWPESRLYEKQGVSMEMMYFPFKQAPDSASPVELSQEEIEEAHRGVSEEQKEAMDKEHELLGPMPMAKELSLMRDMNLILLQIDQRLDGKRLSDTDEARYKQLREMELKIQEICERHALQYPLMYLQSVDQFEELIRLRAKEVESLNRSKQPAQRSR